MNRFKNLLLVAISIVLFAIAAAISDFRQARANDLQIPGAPVKVVNKTSEAVPVSVQGAVEVGGNVSISNTPNVNVVGLPAVQAQQSGAWGVGITNTPNVMAQQSGQWTQTIANTDSNPIPVRTVGETSQKPYQKSFQLTAVCGQSRAAANVLVPAGKRFIIQHISMEATPITPFTQNNAVMDAEMITSADGQAGDYPLDFHDRQSPNGDPRYVINASILAFADSQTDISILMDFDFPVGDPSCGSLVPASGTVSGYLVDMP